MLLAVLEICIVLEISLERILSFMSRLLSVEVLHCRNSFTIYYHRSCACFYPRNVNVLWYSIFRNLMSQTLSDTSIVNSRDNRVLGLNLKCHIWDLFIA